MRARNISITAAALAMAALILDSAASVQAAAEGVELCLRTVIPSLFPFFVLSVYLTGSEFRGKWLHYLGRLFRVDAGCEAIVAAGLIGGYPVGAQAAAESYRSGRISREQAQRLLCFCSQAGPAFLFGMASAQFPSAKYGWLLWLNQILSALSVAWLLPEQYAAEKKETSSREVTFHAALRRAISAMANVCAWVILFRVMLAFANRFLLFLLPKWLQALVFGILELTNGCMALNQITDLSLRFLLASVMLNFGGLCVLMQTASAAEGLPMSRYTRGKLLQTVFSVLYGVILSSRFPIGAAIPLFIHYHAGKLKKRSSFPAVVGV